MMVGDADLATTFVRHRLRIEIIAAAKYQERHRKNDLILILSKDLTPRSVRQTLPGDMEAAARARP